MHLWLLVLVAFTHFIDVASLPTYRERPLDESRGINHKSSLPTQVLPESVTAIIPPRAKDEADDELVDYSQKNLENLKISAGASLGNLLVQPELPLKSMLWSWPSHIAAPAKRQVTCGNNSQCGNGANSTGNGDGVGNNINSGGGGSSQTDRNIALGVGLGVGLPGAIVAMVTIFKCFRT